MTPDAPNPSPIYSAFLTLGQKSTSRPKKAVSDISSNIFACLDQIEAAVKSGSLDPTVKSALEEQLTQILIMGVKAEYSADDVFQMLMDANRELAFEDDGFLEDGPEETQSEATPS